MKKILTIIAAATIFVACNSKSDLDTNKDVVVTDTTNMYKSNASTDISTATQPAQPVQEEKAVASTKIIRETRVVYVDRTPRATKQIIHEASPVDPVVTVPQTQTNTGNPVPAPTTGTTQGNSGAGAGTVGAGGTGTSTPATVPQKDKGWSNAAKDAVIGGVGGAVAGAIISRKKGKGAILGGIIGAAGGYILGKKKDKKDDQTADAKYTSF